MDETTDPTHGEPEDSGSSQADVDALSSGGAGDASGATPPDGDTSQESVRQASTDAGMNHAEGSADRVAQPEEPSAVNQDDLNTLLQAAGNGDAPGDGQSSSPDGSSSAPPAGAMPFVPGDLGEFSLSQADARRVTMLNDVDLNVKLQLGQTKMRVEDVLQLGEGSVVELDKLAGDPVDVLVNDRLIARGEVLVLNDVFCVRISEVLSSDPHRIVE